jgi:hypothetical protein
VKKLADHLRRHEERLERQKKTWRGWKPQLDWLVSFRLRDGTKRHLPARSEAAAREICDYTMDADERIESAWIIELSTGPRPGERRPHGCK